MSEFEDIPIVDRDMHPVGSSIKINGVPGSGKTTQLFRRLTEQIQETGVGVDDMCVVSYRVDLANDLLSKLVDLDVIGKHQTRNSGGQTRWFGTVHGVCRRLIGGSVDIVEDSDKAEWCEQRGWNYNESRDDRKSIGKMFFDIVQWLSINEKNPSDASEAPQYEEFVSSFRPIDFEDPIQDWLNYKEENELYDYYDLLAVVESEGLVPDASILLVDEMHDVYPLMNSVIQMWSDAVQQKDGTVMVAGDTQQVINRYQGARAEFFEQLDLPEVRLTECHERPPQDHWDLATSMLSRSHNPRTVNVEVDGNVEVCESPELPSDGMHSPQDLLDKYTENSNDEVMYLARTQAQCRDISRSLRDSGILFTGSTGTQSWSRRESRYAHKRVALYHTLQILSDFSTADIEKDGWVDNQFELTRKKHLSIRSDDLRHLFDSLPKEYLFYDKDDIYEDFDEYSEIKLEQVAKYTTTEFWSEITSAEDSVDNLSISNDIGKWIYPALKRNDHALSSSDNLPVTVQTIHSSKGSEADIVLLYDGITSRIQDAVYQSQESRENEHRVWYVALTRSKRDLVVVRNAYSYTKEYLTRVIGKQLGDKV